MTRAPRRILSEFLPSAYPPFAWLVNSLIGFGPRAAVQPGFSMIPYPTSILFRLTRAIEQAASDLKNGRQLSSADAVDMKQFEEILS
jgi:hypothetical protein